MEHTLLIVKPDAVAADKVADILLMVGAADLVILSLEMRSLAEAEARAFYAVHHGKDFFEPLIRFMTSGPVVLCAMGGVDAVAKLRTLVGVTDPAEAAPGTVRALFGSTVQRNAVHASDSRENGEAETTFFFSRARLVRQSHSA